VVVGHLARGGDGHGADEGTADGAGRRLADFLAGQHFVEGLPQIVAGGARVRFEAVTVTVVDAAAVAQDKPGVEQERLRGDGGLEGGKGGLAVVAADREGELRFLDLLSQRGGVLFRLYHAQERDPLSAVRPVQVGQHRQVTVRHRAVEGEEDDHDRLAVGQVVKVEGPACGGSEGDIVDLLAEPEGRVAGFRSCDGDGTDAEESEGEEAAGEKTKRRRHGSSSGGFLGRGARAGEIPTQP
jgi:hypothetical protein